MKTGFAILFLILPFISCHHEKKDEELRETIQAVLAKQKGTFAVAFKDLTSGETLFINEHENFHAASTMKTPVMIEVYKQAFERNFSLNDSITIKNRFRSIVDGSEYSLHPEDDSDPELYGRIGEKIRVKDLVYKMIIVSSNLATNMLIERVGADNIMKTMRRMGAKEIQVLRGVEDTRAFEKNINNTTTAFDLLLIFEKLARHEAVSAGASQAMINILLDQHFNEIIPKHLPAEVKVAHKTGNISGVQHDSGIVFLPDGRKYMLVLLSKNLEDENGGIAAMATVSQLIYEEMMKR